MALLDVSEVLLDPDFMDNGLVCERSKEIVTNQGLPQLTTEKIPFSAVVTTHSGTNLERVANSERIKGSITVHSLFWLLDGAEGVTADIVKWKGKRYTVVDVHHYEHFGIGFNKAICNIIPVTG